MGEGRAYAEACARHGLAPLEAVLQVLHGGSPTDLEVKQLGEGDAIAIVAIIGGSCLIRSLSLPHSNIGLDGIGLLGTAIAENTVLSRLSLAWSKGVGDEGVMALARPLTGTDSSRLHELSLCGCNIGLEGIGVLVDALVTLPSFAGGSLDLSHNDLPRMCGILLGKLIRSANGPAVLNVSNNRLGDCGVAALGGALAADMRHVSGPSVVSLRDLNLAYNNMGDRGLTRLVQGVTTLLHPQAGGGAASTPLKLESLVLAGNRITDEGCGPLAELLSAEVVSKGLLLQSLDVSHTDLGDEGITVLADSLCQYPPPPLVTLDLTGVPLGPPSLTALGAALADGSELKGLHVTLPQPGEMGNEELLQSLADFADGVRRSPYLTDLTVQNTDDHTAAGGQELDLLRGIEAAVAERKQQQAQAQIQEEEVAASEVEAEGEWEVGPASPKVEEEQEQRQQGTGAVQQDYANSLSNIDFVGSPRPFVTQAMDPIGSDTIVGEGPAAPDALAPPQDCVADSQVVVPSDPVASPPLEAAEAAEAGGEDTRNSAQARLQARRQKAMAERKKQEPPVELSPAPPVLEEATSPASMPPIEPPPPIPAEAVEAQLPDTLNTGVASAEEQGKPTLQVEAQEAPSPSVAPVEEPQPTAEAADNAAGGSGSSAQARLQARREKALAERKKQQQQQPEQQPQEQPPQEPVAPEPELTVVPASPKVEQEQEQGQQGTGAVQQDYANSLSNIDFVGSPRPFVTQAMDPIGSDTIAGEGAVASDAATPPQDIVQDKQVAEPSDPVASPPPPSQEAAEAAGGDTKNSAQARLQARREKAMAERKKQQQQQEPSEPAQPISPPPPEEPIPAPPVSEEAVLSTALPSEPSASTSPAHAAEAQAQETAAVSMIAPDTGVAAAEEGDKPTPAEAEHQEPAQAAEMPATEALPPPATAPESEAISPSAARVEEAQPTGEAVNSAAGGSNSAQARLQARREKALAEKRRKEEEQEQERQRLEQLAQEQLEEEKQAAPQQELEGSRHEPAQLTSEPGEGGLANVEEAELPTTTDGSSIAPPAVDVQDAGAIEGTFPAPVVEEASVDSPANIDEAPAKVEGDVATEEPPQEPSQERGSAQARLQARLAQRRRAPVDAPLEPPQHVLPPVPPTMADSDANAGHTSASATGEGVAADATHALSEDMTGLPSLTERSTDRAELATGWTEYEAQGCCVTVTVADNTVGVAVEDAAASPEDVVLNVQGATGDELLSPLQDERAATPTDFEEPSGQDHEPPPQPYARYEQLDSLEISHGTVSQPSSPPASSSSSSDGGDDDVALDQLDASVVGGSRRDSETRRELQEGGAAERIMTHRRRRSSALDVSQGSYQAARVPTAVQHDADEEDTQGSDFQLSDDEVEQEAAADGPMRQNALDALDASGARRPSKRLSVTETAGGSGGAVPHHRRRSSGLNVSGGLYQAALQARGQDDVPDAEAQLSESEGEEGVVDRCMPQVGLDALEASGSGRSSRRSSKAEGDVQQVGTAAHHRRRSSGLNVSGGLYHAAAAPQVTEQEDMAEAEAQLPEADNGILHAPLPQSALDALDASVSQQPSRRPSDASEAEGDGEGARRVVAQSRRSSALDVSRGQVASARQPSPPAADAVGVQPPPAELAYLDTSPTSTHRRRASTSPPNSRGEGQEEGTQEPLQHRRRSSSGVLLAAQYVTGTQEPKQELAYPELDGLEVSASHARRRTGSAASEGQGGGAKEEASSKSHRSGRSSGSVSSVLNVSRGYTQPEPEAASDVADQDEEEEEEVDAAQHALNALAGHGWQTTRRLSSASSDDKARAKHLQRRSTGSLASIPEVASPFSPGEGTQNPAAGGGRSMAEEANDQRTAAQQSRRGSRASHGSEQRLSDEAGGGYSRQGSNVSGLSTSGHMPSATIVQSEELEARRLSVERSDRRRSSGSAGSWRGEPPAENEELLQVAAVMDGSGQSRTSRGLSASGAPATAEVTRGSVLGELEASVLAMGPPDPSALPGTQAEQQDLQGEAEGVEYVEDWDSDEGGQEQQPTTPLAAAAGRVSVDSSHGQAVSLSALEASILPPRGAASLLAADDQEVSHSRRSSAASGAQGAEGLRSRGGSNASAATRISARRQSSAAEPMADVQDAITPPPLEQDEGLPHLGDGRRASRSSEVGEEQGLVVVGRRISGPGSGPPPQQQQQQQQPPPAEGRTQPNARRAQEPRLSVSSYGLHDLYDDEAVGVPTERQNEQPPTPPATAHAQAAPRRISDDQETRSQLSDGGRAASPAVVRARLQPLPNEMTSRSEHGLWGLHASADQQPLALDQPPFEQPHAPTLVQDRTPSEARVEAGHVGSRPARALSAPRPIVPTLPIPAAQPTDPREEHDDTGAPLISPLSDASYSSRTAPRQHTPQGAATTSAASWRSEAEPFTMQASRAGVQAPPPIRTTASKTTTRRRRPLSVECRPKGPPPLLLPPTAVGGGQAMPERHEQSTTPRPFVQTPEPPTPGPSPTVTPRGHDGRPQESAAAVEEPLHVGTEVRAADELLTVQATLPAGSRNLRGESPAPSVVSAISVGGGVDGPVRASPLAGHVRRPSERLRHSEEHKQAPLQTRERRASLGSAASLEERAAKRPSPSVPIQAPAGLKKCVEAEAPHARPTRDSAGRDGGGGGYVDARRGSEAMKGQAPPPPSDLSLLGNLSWQDVVGLKACLDNLPVPREDREGLRDVWHRVHALEGKLDAMLIVMTRQPPGSDITPPAAEKARPRGEGEQAEGEKGPRAKVAQASGRRRSSGISVPVAGNHRRPETGQEHKAEERKAAVAKTPDGGHEGQLVCADADVGGVRRHREGKPPREWSSQDLQEIAPVVHTLVKRQAVSMAKRVKRLEARVIGEEQKSIDVLERVIEILTTKGACGRRGKGGRKKRRSRGEAEGEGVGGA